MSLHDIWRGDVIPLSGTKMSIGRNRFDPPAPFVPVEEVIQNIAVFVDPASNTSGVLRFKGHVPTMELSLDGGRTFFNLLTVASGISSSVLFNDNNTIGQDSNFTFNKTLDILGVSGTLEIKNQPNSLPLDNGFPVQSGLIQIKGYSLANRSTIGILGSGTPMPWFPQPSLFNRFIFMVYPLNSTSISSYGNTLTTVGTISHPTPNVNSGVMANLVTGGTAGNTAGTGSATNLFSRATISGVSTGFFFATRMTLPDIAYDGLRAWVGLTTAALATQVGSDNPAGDFAGFMFSTARATDGKFWQFTTKDGTTQTLQSTNVTCSGNLLYDMYIYSPPFPNNGAIYWTIKNLTLNQEVNGYQANNLPRVGQTMKAGVQISNVVAAAKNVRFMHIYCEAL